MKLNMGTMRREKEGTQGSEKGIDTPCRMAISGYRMAHTYLYDGVRRVRMAERCDHEVEIKMQRSF